MKMNSQTRIIVFTAVALTAIDLAVRGMISPRPQVVYVNRSGGDIVTAREFRLVDNDGNLRAQLYTDENSEPGLVLYDRNNAKRAQLDTFQNIPSLILYNANEQRSSYFGMDTNGLGMLDMYGLNGADGADGGALASINVTGTRPTFSSRDDASAVNLNIEADR